MRRFQLMKIYVAAVLIVLLAAIIGAAWLEPDPADATAADADPLHNGASTMQSADGNGAAPADATKPHSGE